jgi:integrase/recombinase XerD
MQLSLPFAQNPRGSGCNLIPQEINNLYELITRCIESLDIKDNSKYSYAHRLKHFIVWLQATHKYKHMDLLTRLDILAYKEYMIASGKSCDTINGYITAVRIFFDWLEREKIYPDSAKSIKGLRKSKGYRKDCLSSDQVKRVLECVDRSTLLGMRDYALINILVRTGLRINELSMAKIEDMRLIDGMIVLWVQGKGSSSKDEFVLLVDESLGPLQEYLNMRGLPQPNDPLIGHVLKRTGKTQLTTRIISKIVKKRFKAAGLDSQRLTAHSLRHTAISLSIKGGAPLIQVQAMARHADLKTTMIYFHNQSRITQGAERYIKI